ncbi:MAG TPA: Ig-like domain-containing protein [Gemmatimonadaceae bacterium]|nr:Ig-like domain-containing protein [Gemmatimonadaceae bacterium]
MTRPWILALCLGAAACGYRSAPTQPATPPVSSVVLAPASPTVAVGQTVQLTATALDAHGGAIAGLHVTWGSSDPAVATVDQHGLVMGIAGGNSKISATISGATGALDVAVTTH